MQNRRIGGAAIQVPLEVDPERGTVLAMQWLQHEIVRA
jgi:ribosomal protein S7